MVGFCESFLLLMYATILISPLAGTVLPDADDTAKAITALHYLGRKMSVDSLLQAFEGESCFKTYPGERNPSVSANCNVLICLLTRDNPMKFYVQITKILHFVSRQLISGASNEKWVCYFSMYLLNEANMFCSIAIDFTGKCFWLKLLPCYTALENQTSYARYFVPIHYCKRKLFRSLSIC